MTPEARETDTGAGRARSRDAPEKLSGVRIDCEDPFAPYFSRLGGQDLQPHQEAVIARAAELARRL